MHGWPTIRLMPARHATNRSPYHDRTKPDRLQRIAPNGFAPSSRMETRTPSICGHCAWGCVMNDANRILPADMLKPSAPYGQHIALMCINHPHLRWTTKNIAPLGCRTIFYVSNGPECECTLDKLRVVE